MFLFYHRRPYFSTIYRNFFTYSYDVQKRLCGCTAFLLFFTTTIDKEPKNETSKKQILTKKNLVKILGFWSGKRGSNPRPSPWQGDALSTELFPHESYDI